MSRDYSKLDYHADVAIIGAGPCGLFQVFELGLYGLSSIVVDALPQIGGQCIQLYPNKPIYDIPALPCVTAKNLVENLVEQSKPFSPQFLLGERIIQCNSLEIDAGFVLTSESGKLVKVKAVVIATGAGVMTPVPLRVKDTEKWLGTHIFQGVRDPEVHANRRVAILGGGDSAFDWALELQKIGAEVVLVHRSTRFRAATDSVTRFMSLCEQQRAQFFQGQVKTLWVDNHQFLGLKLSGADHVTRSLSVDQVIVCFGMVPDPFSLQAWNIEKEKFQVKVSTATFETSAPGIYAIGDCNYYAGKKKLILSGFHEAALAAFSIKERLSPNQKVHLEYTTTSSSILSRLGLKTAV
ncbi:MAG TPA: ferredoxin--NADP(+) reductase [Gammaproteobacteria bacterium]|nr:ferredoxin--NADP(+) reductase [Gammaproteobacteria bacterium]